MDRTTALALAGTPQGYETPKPDLVMFRKADPEVQERILRDKERWDAAVAIAENEAAEPAIEPAIEPTTVTPEAQATEPAEPETPETKPEETPAENPFASWGWNTEQYQAFLDAGLIKDGKVHGRFGPDQQKEYIVNSLHEASFRGQQANEIGELRQENKKAQEQLENQVTFTKTLLESDNMTKIVGRVENQLKHGLDTLDVMYESPVYPNLTQIDSDSLKAYVDQLVATDPTIRKKFKRADASIPRTADDLENLQTENSTLYDAYVDARDNVLKSQLSKIYTMNAIENQYKEIKTAGYFDAANKLYNNLQDEGLQLNSDNPKVLDLVKEAVSYLNNELEQAQAENRLPDAKYFTQHPVSGHALPKADAFDTYVRSQRKDVIREIHAGKWTEPATETPVQTEPTPTTVTPQDYIQTLKDMTKEAFANIKGPGFEHGLEITDDDPLYARALPHFLNAKDDPLYWDNGKLRPDAVVRYLNTVDPSHIPGVIAKGTQAAFQAESERILAERKTQLENTFSTRQQAAANTLPTIAQSIAQTQPGQQFPPIDAETYKSAPKMAALAHKLDIPVKELYSRYRSAIEQLPVEQRNAYLGYSV